VVLPVITNEALTTEYWWDNDNICASYREEMPWCLSVGNQHVQGICPCSEWLTHMRNRKPPTLALVYAGPRAVAPGFPSVEQQASHRCELGALTARGLDRSSHEGLVILRVSERIEDEEVTN
jgi:hypothetical protein